MDPVTMLAIGLFVLMVVAWVALPGGTKTGIEEQDVAVATITVPSSSAQ